MTTLRRFSGVATSYAASCVILKGEYFVAGIYGQLEAFTASGRPLY